MDYVLQAPISPYGGIMRPLRLFSGLVLFLALLLPLTPLAAFAEDVEVAHQVTVQVTVGATAPTVSFQFYSDSGYSTPTTEFTPQTPVYMKISVSTDNVLEEVEIVVDMFADTDANAVGQIPSTTSPETHINFTIYYDTNNNQWALSANTGNSATWSISLDSNQPLPDPSATSGDFYIVIVPGKTAREASTTESAEYADWDVVVKATVAGTATGTAENYGYVMYFDGEVGSTVTTLDFGTVYPSSSSDVVELPINVIANGQFNVTALAPSTLSYESYTISLTTSSPPGTGEYLMQASSSTDTDGNLLNPVILTDSLSSSPPILAEEPATTEAGSQYTIYFQLQLGSGIHTGTYTGTMSVYAVDAH